jgi:hypothetical protein
VTHPTPWRYDNDDVLDANNEPVEMNPYYLIGLVNSICAERDELRAQAVFSDAALRSLAAERDKLRQVINDLAQERDQIHKLCDQMEDKLRRAVEAIEAMKFHMCLQVWGKCCCCDPGYAVLAENADLLREVRDE